MSELSNALKKKIHGQFTEASKFFMDAAEPPFDSPAEVASGPYRYYPSITLPLAEGVTKKPGDKCFVMAVAEVERVDKKGYTVKIKKVMTLPAEAEKKNSGEGDEYGEETEE